MALIPDETIEQILERVDIVDLATRYMTLKRSGINNMGCCPFHDEKSPSFNVNSARQRYHCFGCQANGHAITLLMHFEGLSFPEACKRLAAEVGIEIEERRPSAEEERQQQERERLQRTSALAAAFFHQQLLDAPDAENCRQYLNRRGYGRTSATDFQLGYAPERWDGLVNHLRQQGASLDDARTLGLIRRRDKGEGDYDLFRGRLIFPIQDLGGRIVAFGGRILGEGQPKYINSPESPLYHKGQLLFGLCAARPLIRQASEVILVEGYFDQLALVRAGVGNAVATCGTALTADHAQLLKRYTRRVLLLFDNDKAGRSATFKAMELILPLGLEAGVVELEAGEDPDSFLQKRGKEAFAAKLQSARPVVELFMQDRLQAAPAGATGVARAAQQVLDVLALLPNPLEADLSLKEFARLTGLEVALLQQQLAQVRSQQQERNSRQRRPAVTPEPTVPPPPEELPRREPVRAAPARDMQRLKPVDIERLKQLVFEQEAREIVSARVEDYFFDDAALKLARELLKTLEDVALGDEVSRLQQRPELLERLPRPLSYNREAYAEGTIRDSFEKARAKVADERLRASKKDAARKTDS